jgi:hypothetical protein
MKYKEMYDWLNEVENYGTRLERLYNEFSTFSDIKDYARLLKWLDAAWNCARMESDETEESEIDIERSFK